MVRVDFEEGNNALAEVSENLFLLQIVKSLVFFTAIRLGRRRIRLLDFFAAGREASDRAVKHVNVRNRKS